MKRLIKTAGLLLILSSVPAFGQAPNASPTTNPPTNTGGAINPNSATNPGSTVNPINEPAAINPAGAGTGANTTSGWDNRPQTAGPARDDRAKVACASNEQAVVQGDRIVCMSTNNQPSSTVR